MTQGGTTDELPALRERSLTLLRAIASNIPDGAITVVDRELRAVLCDGPLFQRLSFPRFEGRPVAESVPATMSAVVVERFQSALAGQTRSFESERGGLALWARYVPLYDEQGQIIAAMNLTLDVTAQKGSERALREAEQRVSLLSAQLQSALEAGEMGAWVFDLEKQLMWGNETQRSLWRMGSEIPEWFAPELANDRIHPDDRERTLAEAYKVIEQGGEFVHEFRLASNEGETRWIATRARVERDAQGKPLKLLGVNYDITKQKRSGDALSRSQKLEALGTLSSGIAHDFNNILQAITGNAAMGMSQLPEGHAAKHHVREIARAAARATDLVKQILAFTQPQEQKRRVVALRGIVEEALRLVRATLRWSIEIRSQLDEGAPSVFADPSEVHQVIVNLATNAAHAIGERGGTITVALRERMLEPNDPSGLPAGLYAELGVQDDGCGMDEATLQRIFDPFFTTKPVGEGTGLGLSVVHGIMRSLQGAVTARSRRERGSLFQLYFPAAQGAPSPLVEEPPRFARGQGQRILFVDDEPALTVMGKHMLMHLGYEAEVYNDPREAAEAFASRPTAFAAVITDLSMPVMTGFELSLAVHRISPLTPVLVASGYARNEEQEQAARIGVSELLLKPVSMERLADALARLFSAPGA